jgi:hypothetical protein
MGAQHLQQHLAAPRRVRGEQHAPGVGREEVLERRERPLGAQIDAPFQRLARGKIVPAGVGGQLGVDLERVEVDAREGVEPRLQFVGCEEQLPGCQDRPLDVVPPLLVALRDAARRAFDGARQLGGRANDGRRR